MEIEKTLPEENLPRVVVVGAGFGGLYLTRALRKSPVQVVLVDVNNYHRFQPLMYQVASAGLEPGSICSSVRGTFGDRDHFYFRMARALAVDADAQCLLTSDGKLSYDYLVLGMGAEGNFFGNETIRQHALTLNNIRDALSIRERLIENLEQAIKHNHNTPEKLLNLVIVGGGPTGIEMAGALAELRRYVLPGDYPDFDMHRLNIYLLEGMDRLLPAMSTKSGRQAEKDLRDLGVKVCTGKMVADYRDDVIRLDDGETIDANLLIWSAGVKARPLRGLDQYFVEKAGFEVDEYNRIGGMDSLFAIGDGAHQPDENFPKGLPMLAPVAIQQAKSLAYNIDRWVDGKKPKKFRYKNKGMLATIGRNRAIAELPSMYVSGRLGWYLWLFVHLLSIMGFRRKFSVLSHWIWNYVTYDKGNRMILNFKELC